MINPAKNKHTSSEHTVSDLQPDVLQRMASDPLTSAWVTASAGSGKTKVLSDRVTRLLLNGVSPQKILCLTFTKAGAAEMSIRITAHLAKWATCSDDELRKDLDKLQNAAPQPDQMDAARRLFAQVLECPGGMRIRTIHAFCQEILRRFPLEAGLPPHFILLDDPDAKALQHDALSDLLQRAASHPNTHEGQALQRLISDLGEESFTGILCEATKDPRRLANALADAGGRDGLIAAMRRALELTSDDCVESILTDVADEKNFKRKELLQAARLLLEKGSPLYQKRASVILQWLELSATARIHQFDTYKYAFLTKEDAPFKDVANKEIVRTNFEIEGVLRYEATRLTLACERLQTISTAEKTAALITLATALSDTYAARKKAQAALDYDDLIRHTEQLLQRSGIAPWVLYKLDGGLDHILVDEAQDTSPEQWSIIQSLTDEFFAGSTARSEINRTLFVVGDEKQSIYSFRGADPAYFSIIREHFENVIVAAKKNYREVPMNISFRSAPAILKAVDAVFAPDHVRQGVSHDDVIHRAYHREAIGHVEVWPLFESQKDTKDQDENWTLPLGYDDEPDPAQELAKQIAIQIKQWITNGIIVQKRAAAYGDIMVLVRRRNSFVNYLVRALKKNGVPVTGVDRMKLTQQLPVMDLMALVQFVLLPNDDLTLATLLRCPLLGCTEDQLMHVAIGRRGSLWAQLLVAAEKDPAFAAMCDYLQRWLALADNITPFAFLARVLSEPCPANTISGRRALWIRLGPEAQDPIDEMLNAAQEFGTSHTPSLQAFSHWLNATEVEIKREMQQAGGQVRITTIHSAKGLEAPIIIMPDTVAVPKKNDLPKWLWDKEGNIPFYVPAEPTNGFLQNLHQKAREQQLEEYRRLLYVALTRAADALYVCGWKSKNESFDESWYNLITQSLTPLHEPFSVREQSLITPQIAFTDAGVQTKVNANAPLLKSKEKALLPAWAYAPPPSEPSPPRPLVPSKPSAPEPPLATPQDKAFARGRIIHRLLQSLPDVADEKRDDVTTRFLANPQHALSAEQQTKIADEVLRLLRNPNYAPLFALNSRAEVPIMGRIGNSIVSGQIDRLCVRDDSVWIIDYKTNRPPPDDVKNVPDVYRRQLAAYATVLREIYPGLPVKGFLLWTYNLTLMPIPEQFLFMP